MEELTRVKLDDTLNALAHIQRRQILVALIEDSPIEILDLHDEHCTAEEQIKMRHIHIPKLENYRFITWDQERGKIQRGPNFNEIRQLLDLLDDHEDELPPGWL